tara:strand:- start:227 stop:403 length:177 start_codon:yes stop_codon:yes gene_type:complete
MPRQREYYRQIFEHKQYFPLPKRLREVLVLMLLGLLVARFPTDAELLIYFYLLNKDLH